jgi:ABC-2 type transport system permease protein
MTPPSDTQSTDNGASSDARSATHSEEHQATTEDGYAQRVRQAVDHARLIARTELRRRRRALGENPGQLVGLGLAGLMGSIFVLVLTGGAYFFGRSVGTGAFADQLPYARMIVSGVWGYAVFLTALRTLQNRNSLDASAMILTAVPYSDAVGGLLLSEYVVVAGIAALPVAAVTIAFALGAGSLATLLVGPIVIFAVLVFGVTCGYAIGIAGKTIAARYAVVARFKTPLAVLAFVAYFVLITTGGTNSVFGPLFVAIEATPLGWFADLALVAAPDPAIGVIYPATAAATLLVGMPLVGWMTTRLAGILWYTDPARPNHTSENSGEATAPADPGTSVSSKTTINPTQVLATGISDRVFGGWVSPPVLRIAQKSWRRAYRAPMKLQYTVFPIFFLINPIQQSIQSGEIATVLPASVAIYGAWATGAAFTLNPLGDEGAMLPVTLTTPVAGTKLLSGLVLSGMAVGAPVTGAFATVLGVLSPMNVLSAVAFGTLGVVLCGGACTIGVGVGTMFPKFERTRISRSRKAIVPSLSAFIVYSLSLLIVALPGLLGGIPYIADVVAGTLGISAFLVTLGGLVLTAVFGIAVGWIATRSAGKTIDGYRL